MCVCVCVCLCMTLMCFSLSLSHPLPPSLTADPCFLPTVLQQEADMGAEVDPSEPLVLWGGVREHSDPSWDHFEDFGRLQG